MQRKLEQGQAVDVSKYSRLGPYYVAPVDQIDLDVDYCDAETESWIWSIGQCAEDLSFQYKGTHCLAPSGTILISLGNDLYQRKGVNCLWLR